MSSSREYAGYLYLHFKREAADGEQIHFALSEGNDPLHFDDLNGGKPLLCSALGEGGVRDPHVVRSRSTCTGLRSSMTMLSTKGEAITGSCTPPRATSVNSPSRACGSIVVTAANWKPLAEGIGLDEISRGEGPLVYKSNTEDKWFLWIDEFTSERRYVPFETTNLADGQWAPAKDFRLPKDPCHGVVLPVTAEEYQRLSAAWGDRVRSSLSQGSPGS